MLSSIRFGLGHVAITSGVYGMYIIVSGISLYLLLRHGHGYAGRTPLILYSAYSLFVGTAWYAGNMVNVAVILGATLDEAATSSVENVACSSTYIFTMVCATLQIFGSDALLLYRTFTMWQCDKRVMLPCTALYLFSLGSGIVRSVICSTETDGRSSRTNAEANTCFVFTFFGLNILASLLMAFKVRSARRARGVAGTYRVLVFTVVFWAISVAIAIPSSSAGTVNGYARFALSDAFQYTIVLLPAFIILRVALRQYHHAGSMHISGVEISDLPAPSRFTMPDVINPPSKAHCTT